MKLADCKTKGEAAMYRACAQNDIGLVRRAVVVLDCNAAECKSRGDLPGAAHWIEFSEQMEFLAERLEEDLECEELEATSRIGWTYEGDPRAARSPNTRTDLENPK